MAQFELAVLGMPRVQAHGQPVKFATRKAQALLIFLAVEQVPIARDKLIDLLWADSDLPRGQMSLRRTLAHLRQALNERTPIVAASQPLLLAEAGTLAINPNADCRVDVRVLDQAYALSRSFKAGAAPLPELRVVLEQAAAAYAGDFLDGFSPGDSPVFEDWATVQREKWHTRFSAVLDRLSQLQFEGGEFAAGIETVTRWVRHDALNEIAHRRLMQLHLAAGNRAGALDAYQACEAVLARELNAGPSPETVTLADMPRTQTVPTMRVETMPETERPRAPATALIGRAEEHRQLVHAYRLARDGQSQAVVIQGEPGIGKTRLAQEFLGWAAAQGAGVSQAAAYELTVNLPYQVWADAFRAQLREAHGRAALAALDPHWHAMLAHLLPELDQTNVATEGSAGIDTTQNKHQLFEAAFRFLQQLTQPPAALTQRATQSPHILFLDDVQWMEAASLDMLHHLARRCVEERLPIMLVMTLRAEANDAFEAALSALQRHVQVKPLALKPLSEADSQHLVQALITQAFKQDTLTGGDSVLQFERFAHTLFGETAGHPLYLLETFKSLHEEAASREGQIAAETVWTRWQQALEGWLAPGVKAVIGARLQRVSPQAMRLINAVAVLGQRNDFEVCRRTANLEEDDALNQLDEAVRRGLLRESANSAITFTHDKIREVVYAELSASRRRSLHRRSAETLEQLYPQRLDAYATLIAGHFDASDDPRATAYYRQAGHAAAKVYAYHEAAVHYARAITLAVAEERGLQDAEQRAAARAAIADLHFKLASMHIQVAHYGASVETIRQLGALAREWQDESLEHVTQVWIAPNLPLPGPGMRLDEAEQLAEQILAEAHAAQSLHDEVQAVRTLMRVAMYRTQFDRAQRYGQEILARVDVWPNEPLHGYVLTDLVSIESFRHHFDAAQRFQTEAFQLWRALDRPALVVTSLSQASFIAMCRGEFEVALSLSREAVSISQRANNDWPTRLSQAHVGPAYFELGQVDHAIEVMQEAIQLSRLAQQDVTHILTSADLARVYSRLGRVSEGLEVAQSAYAVADLRMREWRPCIVPVLVQLHVQQHQLPQAQAWLAHGSTLLDAENPWPAAQILLDASEAELSLAQDDAAHALALTEKCVAACRLQDWRQQMPAMLLLQARALHAQGRLGRRCTS